MASCGYLPSVCLQQPWREPPTPPAAPGWSGSPSPRMGGWTFKCGQLSWETTSKLHPGLSAGKSVTSWSPAEIVTTSPTQGVPPCPPGEPSSVGYNGKSKNNGKNNGGSPFLLDARDVNTLPRFIPTQNKPKPQALLTCSLDRQGSKGTRSPGQHGFRGRLLHAHRLCVLQFYRL